MPKPAIDRELLQRVAQNARLNLTEKELDEFIPQFQQILGAFSKLDELKTDEVKPSVQPTIVKNVLRKDEAKESLTPEQALQNTQHKKGAYFKGPRVV